MLTSVPSLSTTIWLPSVWMWLLSGKSRIVRVGSQVRPPSVERANSVSPENGEAGLAGFWICRRSQTA